MAESLEDMFRRIVREEVAIVLEPILDQFHEVETRREQREAVRTPSTPVESAAWHDDNQFPLRSGSKSYVIQVGNPVKVKGLGRGGGIGDGYTVTRIQRRGNDVNVDVKKGVDHTRTVKADKIIYKRPKKGN